MENVVDRRYKEHENRVQHIEVHLMCLKMPPSTLNVLNCTEDGSHHDQCADGVQDVDVANPWGVDLAGGAGRAFGHFAVEKPGHDDEESEDDELDAETADNEVAAKVAF